MSKPARGASVVTAPDAVATEKDPQMSHGNIHRKTEVARAKSRAKRPAKPSTIPSDQRRDQAGCRPRPAKGATITAIMKTTGWQIDPPQSYQGPQPPHLKTFADRS